jgi:hypothetical protein
MNFEAPIPGQSLTKEPRNHPWERPPETADAEEAIVHHITRLSKPEVIDNVVDVAKIGAPSSFITELVLTGGVANGIHSIDISMAIAPVVQEHVNRLLEDAGVEYKEFFDTDEEPEKARKMAIASVVEELDKTEDKDEGFEVLDEGVQEVSQEKENPKRKGLMSRKVDKK